MGQKEFSNWGRKLGLPKEGIGGIVVGPDVCMLGWIRVLDGFENESLQLSHEIFRLATQETDIWISATRNQDPSCPTSQQEEDKEIRWFLLWISDRLKTSPIIQIFDLQPYNTDQTKRKPRECKPGQNGEVTSWRSTTVQIGSLFVYCPHHLCWPGNSNSKSAPVARSSI
jgi:hypothetical protein